MTGPGSCINISNGVGQSENVSIPLPGVTAYNEYGDDSITFTEDFTAYGIINDSYNIIFATQNTNYLVAGVAYYLYAFNFTQGLIYTNPNGVGPVEISDLVGKSILVAYPYFIYANNNITRINSSSISIICGDNAYGGVNPGQQIPWSSELTPTELTITTASQYYPPQSIGDTVSIGNTSVAVLSSSNLTITTPNGATGATGATSVAATSVAVLSSTGLSFNGVSAIISGGGTVTFSPNLILTAYAFTVGEINLPILNPTGSTGGLAIVFTPFVTGQNLYAYPTMSYDLGTITNVSVTIYLKTGNPWGATTTITGFSWIAYYGDSSTINTSAFYSP